jgi:hypothetical protein
LKQSKGVKFGSTERALHSMDGCGTDRISLEP